MMSKQTWVFAVVLASASLLHADTLSIGNPASSTTLAINDYAISKNLGYPYGLTAAIDPYKATLNGNQQILVYCIDPNHFDASGPYTVNVSTSPLGAGTQTLQYMYGNPNPANTYGELAYLSQLLSGYYSSSAPPNVLTAQEIQAAIWDLSLRGHTPSDTSFVATAPSGINQNDFNSAYLGFENQASNHAFTSGFEILTDSACNANDINTTGCHQEFLVLTPEPSSFLLLCTGLFGAFLRRFKN
jgi:hypothetical protein